MAISVPILVYHRVHADDEVTVANDFGRVNLSEFQRQMQYLQQSGISVVTHREIADWLLEGTDLPARTVAIDFDDNRLNVLENAYPVMREYGFCGTVFVITDLAESKQVFGPDDYPAMTWQHLAQLRDAGWCVAPHTRRHLWLAGPQRAPKDDSEAWDEMAQSKQILEQRLGMPSPFFAYPSGSCNVAVETMARQLFRTARLWHTAVDGPWPMNGKETNPHRLIGINISLGLPFERFCEIIDNAGKSHAKPQRRKGK